MQTQSISLVTTAVSQNVSTKTTKANGDTFERFMSDHGTKLTEKKETDANTVNTDRANKDDVQCDLNKNKDVVKSDKGDLQLSDNKVDCTGNGQTGKETKTLEEESVQAVTEQIVTVIAQVLQVPVEQVQDILNQAGIDVSQLAQSFLQDGTENVAQIAEISKDILQAFHGITDAAAFITDDSLGQKLSELTGEIKQALDSYVKSDVSQTDAELQQEMTASSEPQVQVSVEDQGEGGASSEDQLGQGTLSRPADRKEVSQETIAANNLNTFTEWMEATFEDRTVLMQGDTKVSMRDITEQVLGQVKVRVTSETTNLEIQLHPASLGRVNIQVSAAAQGITTATLFVENEMAKQALESQMLTLKQNFQEQGLKVDAVEVTVSNFNLESEGQQMAENGQSEQRQSGGRSRTGTGETQAPAEEMQESPRERRDINSTVDYTA